MDEVLEIRDLNIEPIKTSFYVPPIIWKGDSVGHIGTNDLFFFVLEGECYLNIDGESFIIKPGQMAYLPKGKMRTYTHTSQNFKMYELAFSAKSGDKNIMEILDLMSGDYVVDVDDSKYVSELFENSYRVELYKSALHIINCCANVTNLISIYAAKREKLRTADANFFKPVIEYMSKNIDKTIKTDEFAELLHMQTTYFIRKFKKQFSIPPIAYFNRLKIYRSMTLLTGTDLPVDKVAQLVGIADSSYFARIFKQHTKITPTMYRNEFKRNKW